MCPEVPITWKVFFQRDSKTSLKLAHLKVSGGLNFCEPKS